MGLEMDDGERKSRYRKYPLTTQVSKASTNDTIPYIKYLLIESNGGDNKQVYVDIMRDTYRKCTHHGHPADKRKAFISHFDDKDMHKY